MAVKRETRQFKVGPIGVARSSRSGAIIGEAVADSANALSDIFYKRAAENAERRGIESVGQLSDEEVLALDPVTGLPQAYKAPKGFGRIASNARRRALATRFETEIDVELNEKAKEFRVRYRNSPEAFKKAMTDYIAEIMNVEESSIFTQAIENKGANITNNVYAGLQLEALAEHDRDMAKANAFANDEYLIGLEYAYETGDMKTVKQLSESIDERNQTDLDAQYIFSSDLLTLPKRKAIARARGIVKRTLSNTRLNINQIKQLGFAIASGNPDTILNTNVKEIGGLLQQYKDDPSVIKAIQELALPLLQTAENNQKFISGIKATQRITESNITSAEGLQNDLRQADSSTTVSILESLVEEHRDNVFETNNDKEAGRDATESEARLLRTKKLANGAAEALIGKIVADADFDDFRDIETYLAGRDENLLAKIKSKNPNVGNRLQALLEFEQDLGMEGSNFTGNLVTAMNSITDVKRHNQYQNQFDNFVSIENTLKNTSDILTEGNNYTNVGQDLIDKIRSADISNEQKRVLLSQLDLKFGNDFVRQAYSGVNNEGLLAALDYYAKNGKERPTDTGVDSPLPDEKKNMLDAARKHLGQDKLNSVSNTKRLTIAEQLEAAKLEAERVAILEGVPTGATENKEKNRLIVESLFQSNIPDGYKDLADFISNPNIPLTEENFQEIQQFTIELQKYHKVPPQAIINVLKQAATQGGFANPNKSLSRVLRFYRAIGNPTNPVSGVSFPSSGLDVDDLTKENRAVLDALVIAEMDIDPELDDRARDAALTRIAKDTLRIMTDPDFRSLFLKSLPLDGETSAPNAISYVYRVLEITDQETAERVAAGLRAGFATATATGETFDPQKIKKDVLKATAKEDARVRTFGTSSDLSPFALDITTDGRGDDFARWARAELNRVMVKEGRLTPEDFIEGEAIGQVNFVAVGYDTQTKGQVYALVDENNVAYPMETTDEDGEVVRHAIFVSTKDPMFEIFKKNKDQILGEEAAKKAQEIENRPTKKEEVSTNIISTVSSISDDAKSLFEPFLNTQERERAKKNYSQAYNALFVEDPSLLSNADRRRYSGRLLNELRKIAKINNKDIMDDEYKLIREALLELTK